MVGQYTYLVTYSLNMKIIILSVIQGKLKNKNLKPLVGDKVIFDKESSLLKPRKRTLTPICNVDQALIVISKKSLTLINIF